MSRQPKLILADEPTGNLDGKTGRQVIDLLFGLQRRREATLILVTHDEQLGRAPAGARSAWPTAASTAEALRRQLRCCRDARRERARTLDAPRKAASWRLPVVLAIALRELRGGLSGFRIFIACVALGVAVITGVGAVSDALRAGFERQGEAILGGDLTLCAHAPRAPRRRARLSSQASGG